MSPLKRIKAPLKRFTIAITGDFGPQRSHEKIKQWIQLNGGIFTSDISPHVTHLICSKEHFKKNNAMVVGAHKLKSVKIVSFDWLEDSLLSKSPRPERDYIMKTRLRAAAEIKAKKKSMRKDNVRKGMELFEKGCQEFENDMHTDGYHIYRDLTTFAYDITLVRANLLLNKNERYFLKVGQPSLHPSLSATLIPMIHAPVFPLLPLKPRARAYVHNPRAQRLQLYVTHTAPQMFACYAKYSTPNTKQPALEMLAPRGSSWETAWGAFQTFFKVKTQKEWDDRFIKYSGNENGFTYKPPKQGEPRGMDVEGRVVSPESWLAAER